MPSWFDRKDVLNATSGFLAGYGWIAFACFFYLVSSWASAAPHAPDPIHGHIFPHNEHGSITYFSAFQGTSCALLFYTSPTLFMLAIGLSPKKEVVLNRATLSFSMRWERDDPHRFQAIGATIGAIFAPLFIFLVGPTLVLWLNSTGFVTGF